MTGEFRFSLVRAPDYDREAPTSWPPHPRPPHGTVLLLDAPRDGLHAPWSRLGDRSQEAGPTDGDGDLIGILRAARHTHGLSVVARVRLDDLAQDPIIGPRLLSCGIAGVVTLASPLQDQLRMQLTDRNLLPDRWLSWVRDEIELPLRVRKPLLRVIADPLPRGALSAALRADGVAPRTLRADLAQLGLPKATKWCTAARLFHCMLWLQRDEQRTPYDGARRFGYADDVSLSNQIHRFFGVTAMEARRLLGVEWALASWWLRFARRPHPS